MCLQLYLASNKPLRLVPWNESDPDIYVGELSEESSAVKGQFTLPNVYYVGSYMGCGCGFIKEYSDEIDLVLKSYAALAAYIRSVREPGIDLEFFACWAGDEMIREAEHEIGPAALLDATFEFEEKTFYRLTREEAP